MKRKGDRSEAASDREAHRLIKSLLSDEEHATIANVLKDVYK